MDDLLIKYILEETTPEESKQVQQWLAADTANRARFEKLQIVWQLASQPNLQLATDTPQALQRLKQTVKAREAVPHARGIKRIWPRVWTAAAAMVGIAGVALGAYVLTKPKTTVKEQPPVVQPDTVLQKPVQVDTMPRVPAMKPVPALPADTIPFVKPRKKTRPAPVTPVQPVHPKKKAAQQPTQPIDTTHRKKKHPVQPAAQPAPPPKKKLNRQPPIS